MREFRVGTPLLLLVFLSVSCDTSSHQAPPSPDPPAPSIYETTALKIADFLLSLQNEDGAILDSPAGDRVNEDSNMEYALLGLAAAYRFRRDPKCRLGLERGIAWLAAREEMEDPRWRGSWHYAYSSRPPYDPVPVEIGSGILDVRGVDATSALFVFLLHVHSQVTGAPNLAVRYESHARAALDFLIAHNRKRDGSFASSFHRWQADGRWHLWPYSYTADQADVHLGMQAGWLLYGESRYRSTAVQLEEISRLKFFSGLDQRYALGCDEEGNREMDLEGFNGIFPQGYLPWVFGRGDENVAAWRWLQGKVRADGSILCYDGDPLFSMSVAIHALGASALGLPPDTRSLDWLMANNVDMHDGGVRDTADTRSEKYSNVAGFSIMALLGFPAMPEADSGKENNALNKRCALQSEIDSEN